MNIESILTYLASLLLPTITGMLWRYIAKNKKETQLVKAGQQAMLRSQMINDYNKWSERGYAPIYAKETFENCYQIYHLLGANGVMDDIHDRFMNLPLTKGDENK